MSQEDFWNIPLWCMIKKKFLSNPALRKPTLNVYIMFQGFKHQICVSFECDVMLILRHMGTLHLLGSH